MRMFYKCNQHVLETLIAEKAIYERIHYNALEILSSIGMNVAGSPEILQILMDADLIADAPTDQRFYTAMDSYIHASESLRGTFINEFARGFAEKSQDMCREVFLQDLPRDVADEKLMVASYLGGLSIAYSQVGVAHALSYGLSFVLGTRHGIGNCIVFDQIEEYYPEDVAEFRQMLQKHSITLPKGLCVGLTEEQMNTMVRVALSLGPLWENALGPDWKDKMTPDKCRELYQRM